MYLFKKLKVILCIAVIRYTMKVSQGKRNEHYTPKKTIGGVLVLYNCNLNLQRMIKFETNNKQKLSHDFSEMYNAE